MPPARHVFDADEVHYETRRQVVQLTSYAALAAALTLGAALLAHAGRLPMLTAGIGIAATWTAVVWWIARRLRRLRRVVWCLKLSAEGVTGYDYARRTLTVPWTKLRRVELSGAGLRLVRSAHCYLDVPAGFAAFADLGHRVVAQAEAHGADVLVDGRPYLHLDVYAHFPFLQGDSSPGAPGAPHGSAHA